MTSTPAGANADTVEMIAARQRVLDAGLFGDLDARLAEILIGRDRIVEVGAGTGHHLAQVLEAHPDSHGLASDPVSNTHMTQPPTPNVYNWSFGGT